MSRYVFIEENKGREHAEYITYTDHGVGHAQRELAQNVHPQQWTQTKANASTKKRPVNKEVSPEFPSPPEG